MVQRISYNYPQGPSPWTRLGQTLLALGGEYKERKRLGEERAEDVAYRGRQETAATTQAAAEREAAKQRGVYEGWIRPEGAPPGYLSPRAEEEIAVREAQERAQQRYATPRVPTESAEDRALRQAADRVSVYLRGTAGFKEVDPEDRRRALEAATAPVGGYDAFVRLTREKARAEGIPAIPGDPDYRGPGGPGYLSPAAAGVLREAGEAAPPMRMPEPSRAVTTETRAPAVAPPVTTAPPEPPSLGAGPGQPALSERDKQMARTNRGFREYLLARGYTEAHWR